MNEHTKALFDKALDQAVPETWTTLSHEQMMKLSSVFAELLIRECVKKVRPSSYSRAYPDNMIGGEDGVRLLDIVADQIEEHFGVKE